jgi:hypothetical protein
MANYNTTTKVIIEDIDTRPDSQSGSYAKEVNDYLETVDNTKTIRSINSVVTKEGRVATIIIHDS